MKPIVFGVVLTMVGGLWTVLPVFAKCETLYAEVQAFIRQGEADRRDPLLLERAKQCAEDGMKRHGQNRHWESMATFRRCLKMFDG